MKYTIAAYLVFNTIYTTIYVLLIACGKEDNMIPWWITIIAAIIPSVITSIVTLYTTKKSQLSKNTQIIETSSSELKASIDSMINDIGRKDNSSLTMQHKDIIKLIEKETSIIEQRHSDEDKRYMTFTAQQHNTLQEIEKFKLFMKDWERLADENNKLTITNQKMQAEITRLNGIISNLHGDEQGQQNKLHR